MTNEPTAFPFVSHGGLHEHQVVSAGMTLRDYFAGEALPVIYKEFWADVSKGLPCPDYWQAGIAKGAYLMADAMMIARGE